MLRSDRRKRTGEGGFTLVEMLVASAIFAIAAAVAFILYTAAQNSYKAGQNFTDQQQNTRAAFDRVLSDLRNAGYNYNPDGSKSRNDEQIEAAYDTAVVLRADLDFEDATLSTAPEASIKGAYNVVSTGNDEIVAYVLAKSGWTGGSTMTFNADIDNPTRTTIVYQSANISVGPRDGTAEPVRLGNVALVEDDPPYTLYRVSLNNDMTTYSSGANPTAASFFVKQPVADNIRSMTFKYYDDQGNLVSPNTPSDASDDIGGGDPNIAVRSRIRRIVVDLVGMTPDPDLKYLDPAEASTSSTAHYRKFDLTSDVTPENLGRSGMQDSDTTPPGQVSPAPTLCGGHCQGVLVNYTGRPASELVTSYNVGYGATSAATPYVANTPYPHYDNGVVSFVTHSYVRDAAHFTQGSTWYFKVQAKDSSGNVGLFSGSASSGTITDTTTPAAPASGWATQKGSATHPAHDGDIEVHWDAVATNATGPTGCTDADAPMIRDLAGYRVWRGSVSGFTPGGTPLANEGALSPGNLQFTDNTGISQCQTYYYKVAAADLCGNIGAYSPAIAGSSDTTIPPMSPSGINVGRTSQNTVTITWAPVMVDVQSRTVSVTSYEVVYAAGTVGMPPSSGAFSPVPGSPVQSPTVTLVHNLTTSDKDYLRIQNNTYYYMVRASDACPNFSYFSSPQETTCTFNGTPSLSPPNATHVAGSVPLNLSVSGGGDTYVRARIRIPSITGGSDVYDQTATSYPFVFPSWNASTAPPGTYTLYIEVENSNGCVNFRTQTLIVDSVLACQISPANPNLSPTTGTAGGDKKSDLTWQIINNAAKDLFIDGIDVTWTNTLGFNPALNAFFYPSIISPATKTWSPAATSPASANFSFPQFLDKANDSTSPLEVKLDFTNSLVSSSGNSGETITIRFRFHDSTSTGGSCTFQVIAKDLSVVTQ
ncbi:MAG TPA: prepilin-type N-terminal cleavage/methylation domain-containing protein [Candidatus Polarisedimenticolia bacterium]|jgi:prepilin-type N-terminal cleavage/methylation domain-containing protein|nr:prepilin-type N-terminal cleavage/methylation domain-containing protein [Candidatus Polarisedimenticolia bacterium]